MTEIWKAVPDYENLYEISNLGNIRSIKYNKNIRQALTGKSKRYLKVCLCKDSIRKDYYVHRLVWIAFKGPIPENLQINHINEIPTDNRLENLNLMTNKENCNYGNHCKNISDSCSKPVNQYDKQGNFIRQYKNSEEAGIAVGLASGSNIRACCLHYKRYKTAAGFRWEFA